jgi:hypothetical protein
MKAAIITAAGKAPVYGDFNEPDAGEGQELVWLRRGLRRTDCLTHNS